MLSESFKNISISIHDFIVRCRLILNISAVSEFAKPPKKALKYSPHIQNPA